MPNIKELFKSVTSSVTNGFKSRLKKSDSPELVGSAAQGNDTAVESVDFSSRHKLALSYVITVCIIIIILAGSFALAVYMPSDMNTVSSYADELRSESSYTDTQSKIDELTKSLDELQTQTDDKKETVSGLADYENTKAELRTQIEESKTKLAKLNEQLKSAQSELDSINSEITKKAGAVITLPAGKYVVGTTLPAGKYTVSGSGRFQASSGGISTANVMLSSSPYAVTLKKDDIIKIEATTKFTPAG